MLLVRGGSTVSAPAAVVAAVVQEEVQDGVMAPVANLSQAAVEKTTTTATMSWTSPKLFERTRSSRRRSAARRRR